MRDLVRDACSHFDALGSAVYRPSAIEALNVEREAHAKEVADLQRRIEELTAQLQDER